MSDYECDRRYHKDKILDIPDLTSLGPHLTFSANFQTGLFMSHLPQLLFEKYGKCIVHYGYRHKHKKITKAILSNNPYVTEFVDDLNYSNEPLLLDMGLPETCESVYQYWSQAYGFHNDKTKRGILYFSEEEKTNNSFKYYKQKHKYLVAVCPKGFDRFSHKQFSEMIYRLQDKLPQFGFYKIGSHSNHMRIPSLITEHNNPRDIICFLSECDMVITTPNNGIMQTAMILNKPTICIANNYHSSNKSSGRTTWGHLGDLNFMLDVPNEGCVCDKVAKPVKDYFELENEIQLFINNIWYKQVK